MIEVPHNTYLKVDSFKDEPQKVKIKRYYNNHLAYHGTFYCTLQITMTNGYNFELEGRHAVMTQELLAEYESGELNNERMAIGITDKFNVKTTIYPRNISHYVYRSEEEPI